jgi:hypothetical protein
MTTDDKRRAMESRLNRLGRGARNAKQSAPLDGQFLAELAVGLWRLQGTLQREYGGGDITETRSWRHLQRLMKQMEDRGITLADKTGEEYDPGMSLKVVHCQEVENLSREIVHETLSPTVFFNGEVLRAGEVIVGMPKVSKNTQE